MENIYIPKRAFCKKSSFLDGFYYIMVKLGEKDIIKESGATSMKDMGIVMKTAKEKIGASADGKTISDVVKKLLS